MPSSRRRSPTRRCSRMSHRQTARRRRRQEAASATAADAAVAAAAAGERRRKGTAQRLASLSGVGTREGGHAGDAGRAGGPHPRSQPPRVVGRSEQPEADRERGRGDRAHGECLRRGAAHCRHHAQLDQELQRHRRAGAQREDADRHFAEFAQPPRRARHQDARDAIATSPSRSASRRASCTCTVRPGGSDGQGGRDQAALSHGDQGDHRPSHRAGDRASSSRWSSDEERERAAVFMDGLAEMRSEWGLAPSARRPSTENGKRKTEKTASRPKQG